MVHLYLGKYVGRDAMANEKITPTKIITHGGVNAHPDEYLAVAFAANKYGITDVERRNPTPEELKDPRVMVIDVGGNPDVSDAEAAKLNNFDHHQWPFKERADHESSLPLVVKHIDPQL